MEPGQCPALLAAATTDTRRLLARPSPVRDSPFSEASLCVVVSQQFGLFLRRFGKLVLQRFGYPPMLDAPIRSEQRVVGSVLDQGVFERVASFRRVAALDDQLGFGKPLQCAAQFVLGNRGHGPQKLVGKFSADYGGRLRDLLRAGKPVEPRHQRVLQT